MAKRKIDLDVTQDSRYHDTWKLLKKYWDVSWSLELSVQQVRNMEEIIELLRPHIRDISFRTYSRRRKEAVETLSSILWGYTSQNTSAILNQFFPDKLKNNQPVEKGCSSNQARAGILHLKKRGKETEERKWRREAWFSPSGLGWRAFHFQMASFFKFMATNLSFTQFVTWAKPLYCV